MSSNRILKNTFALYIRQVFVIIVNLYALRVVLSVLGVNDYGIYTVVVSVVTLSSFIPGTMVSAMQRFFSFALGQNDKEILLKTFSINLIIFTSIGILALVALETIGLWFISEHLSIPPERFETAQVLFHLTVLSFAASTLTAPFMAVLIAHEDMHIYAYLSTAEALMKLGTVFALSYISWDKLELYGYLLLVVAVINCAAYVFISMRKYPECQFRKFYWDTRLFKDVISFTGWTMFGLLTSVVRNQAVTILINQIFNPATVAARAIAMTVANQVMIFSTNFNTSLYPPIIKSYATDQRKYFFALIFNGSKLTFFLMWLFALPLFLEMETILRIWLISPPAEAKFFTQLALIEMLIVAVGLPATTAARAPGKMRSYELILGIMQIGIFVASWYILTLGFPASSVFIVAIAVNIMMFMVRILLLRGLIGLHTRDYFQQVLMPITGVISISLIPALLMRWAMPEGEAYTVLLIAQSILLSSVGMYFLGLNAQGRKIARTWLVNRLRMLRGEKGAS